MLRDLQRMGLIEAANGPAANASVAADKAAGSHGSRFKRPEDVKTAMIAAVKEVMGQHGGEKLIARIQESQPTAMALADAVDSGCIFIKLTVSEDKARLLKERLYAILSARF